MEMRGLTLLYFVLAATDCCSAILPVNVIVVIIGDNPAYGYYVQAPAYDASFESLRVTYPSVVEKVNRYMVHKPGMYSCAEAAAMVHVLSGELDILIRRLNGPVVLISPGCSLELMVLGDFAREWDIPLLATISSDLSLANRNRYPTLVVFGPTDYPSYMTGFVRLLQYFKWTTVTVLCDSLTGAQVATFFQLLCLNIRRVFDRLRGSYLPHFIQFDSRANSSVDYGSFLSQTRKQCRVIIIVTRPHVLREIMIEADRANMTDGSFVFIVGIGSKVPVLEDIDWKYGDANDQVVLRAFRSMIIATSLNPEWDRIDSFLDDIRNISQEQYNHTLPHNQKYNDLTVCAYEVVAALIEVLNDTVDMLSSGDLSSRLFASTFFNRTFSLMSRDIYISPNGIRASDVIFQRLDTNTSQFETTWRYTIASKTFVERSSKLAADWANGVGPPVNLPVCGYSNERCFTQHGLKVLQTSVGAVTAVILLTVIVTIAIWLHRKHQLYRGGEDFVSWWSVDVTYLRYRM